MAILIREALDFATEVGLVDATQYRLATHRGATAGFNAFLLFVLALPLGSLSLCIVSATWILAVVGNALDEHAVQVLLTVVVALFDVLVQALTREVVTGVGRAGVVVVAEVVGELAFLGVHVAVLAGAEVCIHTVGVGLATVGNLSVETLTGVDVALINGASVTVIAVQEGQVAVTCIQVARCLGNAGVGLLRGNAVGIALAGCAD